MPDKPDRRDFMRQTATATGIAAISNLSHAHASSFEPGGEIKIRLTAASKRYSEEPSIRWGGARPQAANTLALDSSAILNNWCRCIIGWNLALDEKGRPNIGHFDCGGLVTIHSETKEITRSGQYWALAHYSRAIRRGARRIDSQGAMQSVTHTAVENPNGSKALVLTNSGQETSIVVSEPGRSADVLLPADSVVTLTWA